MPPVPSGSCRDVWPVRRKARLKTLQGLRFRGPFAARFPLLRGFCSMESSRFSSAAMRSSNSSRGPPPLSGEAESGADPDACSEVNSDRTASSFGPELWAAPVFTATGGHPGIPVAIPDCRVCQNFAIVAARSGSVAAWVRCCCHKSRYRRASS